MDFIFLNESFFYLLRGALVSIRIAGIACLIGLIGGTVLALVQTGSNKFLRVLVTLYITLIRGTPMLVQIMIVFFILPQLGINFSAFWSAVLAIGMNSSAYLSQIIKAGILSIGKGQWEAAQVLGFNKAQTMKFIILPQALRVIIPALGNEFITLLKDSSLASTIGVVELVKEGSLIISKTYKVIPVYCLVTIIYLIMTTILSVALVRFEKRIKRHAHN
ncbi:MAG: Ectoine/hydroxyectoine ABC transporter, permease protein EhuC [candidate division TM6 bacterium GW2011_GWE2_31_21]|nr:MAG: Ectoine/hydroxyectoine ABC transporter, permease protein EhuC [candidate division TM6 bacterium GW2011_GWE2_31_21]KKP54092.1 MAG: Ectoine/hydroxyectoine ABC transporter, permease protein EhuC [candidate division TM6 bacterium GW2011_GWF2_33_332]